SDTKRRTPPLSPRPVRRGLRHRASWTRPPRVGGPAGEGHRPMGQRVEAPVVGGALAVMVDGPAGGPSRLESALGGAARSGPASVRKSGPPDGGEGKEASGKFLAAWERGQATQAAAYTNNAQAADALLTAYGDDARISGVKITPG